MGSLRDAQGSWRTATAIRRPALFLGSVGMIAGAVLLTAGLAQAAPTSSRIGTDPTAGTVVLSPVTGTASTATTWSTTDGCPTGFQTTAAMFEVDAATSQLTEVSGTVNLSGSTAIAAGQALQDTVVNLLVFAGVPNGGSTEWFVKCSSLPSALGSVANNTAVDYQDIEVTLNSSGTGYSVSTPTGTPTPTPTNTSTGTPTPTPTGTSTGTPTPTPTGTPTPTPTATSTGAPTPTGTSTGTAAPIPSATSSVLPSGAPATGAGGASLPGDGNNVLIGLGATLLAGSAAAIGLAIRRKRVPGWEDGPDLSEAGGNT
jgi:hypothetical protein